MGLFNVNEFQMQGRSLNIKSQMTENPNWTFEIIRSIAMNGV